MKKILLGATALSLVAMAGAASAQSVTASTFNARVGGFFFGGFGVISGDKADSDTTIVADSEIIFNFTLTADNGLTFGAKAEIENNGGPQTSDEYVAFVSGSFGRFEIGAEDGAHDQLIGGVPGGSFANAGAATGFLFDYNSSGNPATVADTKGIRTGDALKVTYISPRIAGFQVGASWANEPEAGGVGRVATNVGTDTTAYELGANYQNTFGDISVRVAAGFTDFSQQFSTVNDNSYAFQAQVGYAGFTVGGRYGYTNKRTGTDAEGFGVGADYNTGPWTFGLAYGMVTKGTGDDDYGISAEVLYALAPGVRVAGVLEYADGEGNNAGVSDDAFVAGVWLGLNF